MNKLTFEFKLQDYQHAADLPITSGEYGEPAVNFVVWLHDVAFLIADASLVTSDVRIELKDNARWARIYWSTTEGNHQVPVAMKNRHKGWRTDPQGWCFQFGTPDRSRHGGVSYYGPAKTRNMRLSKMPVLETARDYVVWSHKKAISDREDKARNDGIVERLSKLAERLNDDGIFAKVEWNNRVDVGGNYQPFASIYADGKGYSIKSGSMPAINTIEDEDKVYDRIKLLVNFRNQWRTFS